MTRDDIIRMAEEAGVWPYPHSRVPPSAEFRERVIKFAQLVAAHEREECAQIAERKAIGMMRVDAPLYRAAEEIRQRHD